MKDRMRHKDPLFVMFASVALRESSSHPALLLLQLVAFVQHTQPSSSSNAYIAAVSYLD
jgi:hypothetical protein